MIALKTGIIDDLFAFIDLVNEKFGYLKEAFANVTLGDLAEIYDKITKEEAITATLNKIANDKVRVHVYRSFENQAVHR